MKQYLALLAPVLAAAALTACHKADNMDTPPATTAANSSVTSPAPSPTGAASPDAQSAPAAPTATPGSSTMGSAPADSSSSMNSTTNTGAPANSTTPPGAISPDNKDQQQANSNQSGSANTKP